MKCPYCGAQVPEGDRFCGECGKALSPAPEVSSVSTPPPPGAVTPPPGAAVQTPPPAEVSVPGDSALRPPPSGGALTGSTSRKAGLPLPLVLGGGGLLALIVVCGGLFLLSSMIPGLRGATDTPGVAATPLATAVPQVTSVEISDVTATSEATPVKGPTDVPTPAPTTPAAPLSVDAATEKALRQAILNADKAEINALKTLSAAGLDAVYAGDALQLVTDDVAALKQKNVFIDSTLVDSSDWTFALTDATHADVTLTETWTEQLFDNGAGGLLGFMPNHDVPQVVMLERKSGDSQDWKVSGLHMTTEGPGWQTSWEEAFANNDRKWDSGTDTRVEKNVYRISEADANLGYAVTCKQCPKFSSFAYQLELKQLSAGKGALYGLLWSVDDSGSKYQYYAFLVSPSTSRYYVGIHDVDDQWTGIQDWTDLPSSLAKTSVLKVVGKPGSYEVYMDGVLLTSVHDTTLETGKIGFYGGGILELQADNLQVELPGFPQ